MEHGDTTILGKLLLKEKASTTTPAAGKMEVYAKTDKKPYAINSDGIIFPMAQKLIQVVNVTTGALIEGTTTIPWDDTPPEKTEGFEVMTLAITPTNALNILKIEVSIGMLTIAGVSPYGTIALFKDTDTEALAAVDVTNHFGRVLLHYMTSGTTSAITFKVRVGSSGAGTTSFNGTTGARRYGGICSSSITISEIEA